MFARNELETVACPNCGSASFECLATQDRYRMGLSTVGCNDCGLVLTNPRPTQPRMEKFYAQESRHYYTGFSQPSLEYIAKFRRAERARHHVDFLAQAGLLRPGMRVLDIGCAEGSLLKAIRDHVPDAALYGIEPNPDFVAFSRGYAGLARDWPSLEALLVDSAAPLFDLVTIVHVLEHVGDPPDFLARVASRLAEDGAIYIDVPDLAAYDSIDMLHVAHLFHFSRATLADAARVGGLAVCAIDQHKPPAHPVSLRTVLTRGADAGQGRMESAAAQAQNWDRVREAMRTAPSYFFYNSLAGKVLLRAPRRLARLLGM